MSTNHLRRNHLFPLQCPAGLGDRYRQPVLATPVVLVRLLHLVGLARLGGPSPPPRQLRQRGRWDLRSLGDLLDPPRLADRLDPLLRWALLDHWPRPGQRDRCRRGPLFRRAPLLGRSDLPGLAHLARPRHRDPLFRRVNLVALLIHLDHLDRLYPPVLGRPASLHHRDPLFRRVDLAGPAGRHPPSNRWDLARQHRRGPLFLRVDLAGLGVPGLRSNRWGLGRPHHRDLPFPLVVPSLPRVQLPRTAP